MFKVEFTKPALPQHREVASSPKKLPSLRTPQPKQLAQSRELAPARDRQVLPPIGSQLQDGINSAHSKTESAKKTADPTMSNASAVAPSKQDVEGGTCPSISCAPTTCAPAPSIAPPSAPSMVPATAPAPSPAFREESASVPLLGPTQPPTSQESATHPAMWRAMNLDGLNYLDDETSTILGRQSVARDLARIRGCTRKLVKMDGDDVAAPSGSDLLSLLGHPLQSLDRPRLLPSRRQNLRDFGCSIAVTLFLRFHIETALLFVLLFLLSLAQMSDNQTRGELRNRCREALVFAYDALTASPISPNSSARVDPSSGVDLSSADDLSSGDNWLSWGCGYEGKNVRGFNISLLPSTATSGPLTSALGSCEEYSNVSDSVMPVPFVTDRQSLFVDLGSGSELCTGPGRPSELGLFLQFIGVVLVLCYLVYLKRVVRTAAILEDKSMITTADYSVLLRGLADGMDPSAKDRVTAKHLQANLYADLEELGFHRSLIAQIEVGRNCNEEIKLLHQLETLNIERLELNAREELRRQAKRKPAANDARARAKTYRELQAVVQRLNELYLLEDYATGHAFVVFQYESDRNKFMQKTRVHKKGPRSSVAPTGAVLKRSSMPGRRPEIRAAPEPSEVCWESLELDDQHEMTAVRVGNLVLALLLALGAALIVAAKAVIATDKEDPFAPGNEAVSVALGVMSSVVTTVVNFVVKASSEKFTAWEGQDTQTEFEASLCHKLTLAYFANSVMIPVFLGMIFSWSVTGFPVDQSWYEHGGVLSQAWILVLINAISKEVLKLLMLPVLINRCIKARLVASQAKLNLLWRPPPMHIGEMYASAIKTCSLGLVYGPLYPYIYLLTAFALLFCYVSTRCGIIRWYMKPPAVDEGMMASMRTSLSFIVATMIVLQALGVCASTDELSGYGVGAVIIGAPVAWLVYVLAPLDRLKMFRSYEQDETAEDADGDTDNLRYDEVMKKRHIEMEPYICPKLTEHAVVALRKLLDQGSIQALDKGSHTRPDFVPNK